MTSDISLYVHWPFCKTVCPYCDFNSHVSETINQDRWRDAFLKELYHYASATPGRRLTSIFFGGGTPSLMASKTVETIIERACTTWSADKNLEITLEANPSSADISRFTSYRIAGVNRLSLGVQSLDNRALKFLGRPHNANQAQTAMTLAKKIFDSVSFDFIYARPGQTIRKWREELTQALSLAGNHLSLYQLTIEPGTDFFRKGISSIDQDLAADLFEITQDMTSSAGLKAYEISNYAQSGFESRHNLNYWDGGDYVGIGPGAHGRLSHQTVFTATHQINNPSRWLNAVEHIGHGTAKRRHLLAREKAEEMVMTGLRLSSGLDRSALAARTGVELTDLINKSALKWLIEGGLIRESGQHLIATSAGRNTLNSVIRALLF